MEEVTKSVMAHIRANFHTLSNSEKLVADYVTAHPEEVIRMSLMELAEASGVSDATALRFTRSIGFTGFNDLKMSLVADSVSPIEAIFEEISPNDNLHTIARKIINANIQLLNDTLNVLDINAISKAIDWIRGAEGIYIFAVGTSAPLANTLYGRIFRLGYRVTALTESYLSIMQASILGSKDLAIIISRSGRPNVLTEIIKLCRQNGTKTIAITCDSCSPVAQASELVITVVSREVRADVFASPVALSSVLEIIYTGLEVKNQLLSTQNQNKIWQALEGLRK